MRQPGCRFLPGDQTWQCFRQQIPPSYSTSTAADWGEEGDFGLVGDGGGFGDVGGVDGGQQAGADGAQGGVLVQQVGAHVGQGDGLGEGCCQGIATGEVAGAGEEPDGDGDRVR